MYNGNDFLGPTPKCKIEILKLDREVIHTDMQTLFATPKNSKKRPKKSHSKFLNKNIERRWFSCQIIDDQVTYFQAKWRRRSLKTNLNGYIQITNYIFPLINVHMNFILRNEWLKFDCWNKKMQHTSVQVLNLSFSTKALLGLLSLTLQRKGPLYEKVACCSKVLARNNWIIKTDDCRNQMKKHW